MVCTRSSSTKSDEAGAADVIPPVQTRGRASTARRPAATTRRTRRASATDVKTSDSQELESSALGSRASSEPDPHGSVASPQPIPSTPSRRGRKKQASDTESCASLSDSVFQDTNASQENLIADATKAGSISSNSAVNSQAPVGVLATPSRRRRASSSSSETPQPSSPARITRAMRKAGISTPKDVIELEIVPEEQINVGDEAATFEDKEKREEAPNTLKEASNKDSGSKDDSGLASPEGEVKKSLTTVIAALEAAPLQEESVEKTAKQSSPDITVLGDDIIESPPKITPTGKAVKESSPDITVHGDDFIEIPPKNASEDLVTSAPAMSSNSEQADAGSSNMSPKKSPRLASLSKTSDTEVSLIQEGSETTAKEVAKGTKSPITTLTSEESKRGAKASLVSENPLRSPTLRRISFAESIPSPVRDTVTRVVDSERHCQKMFSLPRKSPPNHHWHRQKEKVENLLPSRKLLSQVRTMSPELSTVQQVGDSPKKSPKRAPLSNKLELLEVQQVAISPKRSAASSEAAPPGGVQDAQTDELRKKADEQPMDVAAFSPIVEHAPESATVTQNKEPADASEVSTEKRKKKSKKASKKALPASGSIVEGASETAIVAQDRGLESYPDGATEKRKRRTKKISKKQLLTEADEDEEEPATRQDVDKYVDLKSFKQCFKRPKFYTKAFRKAIPVLFEYASSIETRNNDLPPELMKNCDQETMWQFISYRCKQISKEFRKRSALLELGLELNKEQLTSEDDLDDEEENLEDEHEEDEEEDVDLLNLKDEDLKDLERELAEMRDDENQDENSKEPADTRKKYPHSVVDDKFFSLAEMNAFLDEQDRAEGQASNILDSVDDSSTVAADYHYEEFFGKADGVGETAKSEKKKGKKRVRSKELDKKEKKKSVRFAMEEGQEPKEEEENNAEKENEHIDNTKVLLGDTEEPKQETSNLKKSLKRLKETIKKLEEENLAPKSWEMSGEVTAQQREENELLETHLEFDLGMKKAPEITEVFTEKLEELIKQRIKDKAFDDVVRKKRIEERTESYRNQAIEEREMVKTSLAEVYEKEYQKVAGEHADSNGVNEEHAAIEKRMRELFRLIDALSNFDYTPPEVRPEVRVVSNMPALQVEEVGMNASTDAQLLAPEEVKKHQKGAIKADEERDRTDKLRQRRKKKNRQRAMVELFGEEKAMEGLKRKKKRKDADSTETQSGEKLKSTTFFTKLQETVRDEIKEKTTKKKKMKKINFWSGATYSSIQIRQPSGAMPPMQAQQQMMQQQRMVMGQPGQAAPGMRQMYPPPPGMMNSQVPGQPMYSHPSQMQQAHIVQQQQFQYYMSRFPHQWQQEIHMEQSQERKKHIFGQYVRKFNNMQQQQKMVSNGQGGMMHQPIMGQGAVMVGPGNQRPGVSGMYTQPQAGTVMSSTAGPIPGVSSVPAGTASVPMPQQQMRMQNHMAGGPTSVPPQMMGGAGMGPQTSAASGSPQVHSNFASHQMAVGSPHMAGIGSAPAGMVNSPANCIQPSTPQNPSSVQPGSVGPGSQQPSSVPSQEENTKEYNDLVASLKEQYYEKLKRIGDRCDLDNSPKPTGFDRLMEILDGKRRVSQSLLEKIVGNVRTIVERSSLTYPVIETMHQIEADGQSSIFVNTDDFRPGPQQPPQAALDPWRSVRHMMIKVPEHLANLGNSDDESEGTGAVKSSTISNPLKRAAPSDFNDSGIEAKVEKLDNSNASDQGVDSSEDENMRIQIECLFDTRQPWRMSVAASKELNGLPWRVDTDCLPASSNSPDAVICFDSDLLLCPPLRVLVPASYPLDPAVIQFDRSFPRGVQISSQLSTMLERSLSVAPSRSLTHIHSAFRSACQELMRLKASRLIHALGDVIVALSINENIFCGIPYSDKSIISYVEYELLCNFLPVICNSCKNFRLQMVCEYHHHSHTLTQKYRLLLICSLKCCQKIALRIPCFRLS
ncbi:unnamed protein product [Cylicocyclus nassatus]|uniref:ARC105/Med15 mediator subunit C-terminal domain-containing protein n=1 Tax=Cylicocyclus nassatus TaxID=53992 RepID=A0AA36GW83_CYLNA|nr:unnamed protein product [Cylicocyclus nassatus]